MDFILLYLFLRFITIYSDSFTFENSYIEEEWTEDLPLEFEISLEHIHRVLYVIIENLARNTCGNEISSH